MDTAERPPLWLIVAVAVLPIACVNLNQLLSTQAGHIPGCFTYIEGCTSISATGRYGASFWLFKAMMLPQCVLLVLFWRSLERVFAARGPQGRWMLRLGVAGAVFLVLYTVFLGSSGDIYRLMRRYGVFVYFLGTSIAQIIATRRLVSVDKARAGSVVVTQRVILAVMAVLAVAELPLGTFGFEDDVAENIIEWNFALLMQLWFASWLLIRR